MHCFSLCCNIFHWWRRWVLWAGRPLVYELCSMFKITIVFPNIVSYYYSSCIFLLFFLRFPYCVVSYWVVLLLSLIVFFCYWLVLISLFDKITTIIFVVQKFKNIYKVSPQVGHIQIKWIIGFTICFPNVTSNWFVTRHLLFVNMISFIFFVLIVFPYCWFSYSVICLFLFTLFWTCLFSYCLPLLYVFLLFFL